MFTSTLFEIGIWNGWLFMSVFILQMMLIIFVDKRIWKRSHIPNHFRQTPFDKYISVIANIVWLLSLGYSIFLPLLFGTTLFYIGFSVFIIGVLLLSLATFSFMTTPIDQLIQKGVYALSRHPMYLATSLICIGTGIATASLIFILLSVIISICFHYEALLEEKYCLSKYQDLYTEYMNRVPRWFRIPK
ncbi:MAG: isoprenylcysteine carboxylmethyltransferase family protein [Ignavibacteriaceae bacterium]|nr:isoprenylcysteine carboxylmethyltransferase family protein [Ignavibacteriaceae bacterium]